LGRGVRVCGRTRCPIAFHHQGETLLHSDEAIVGIMAQDIAEGRRLPIYFYGQRYMGALEAYVIAALSPLFDDPIHALRFGPALFFAALCVLQYLMLTRWFGRVWRDNWSGDAAGRSPMFMQWSISARGGYIEILVWGTALLWTYSEWFANEKSKSRKVEKVETDVWRDHWIGVVDQSFDCVFHSTNCRTFSSEDILARWSIQARS